MTGPGRVVIFDEKGGNADEVKLSVERLGLDAVVLGQGANDLGKIQEMQPDLVLFECREGLDSALFERLRSSPEAGGIPMVALSGTGTEGEAARFLSLGADDFLELGNDPALVSARLESCLKRRRDRGVSDRKIAELERALAFRTALMRMASHDLRNPLGIILGYLDMLQATLETGKQATDKDMDRIGKIRRAAARMQQMLSTFLSYQRIHGDKIDLEIKRTDLLGLVRETKRDAEEGLAERGIALKLEEQPGTWEANGDATCLKQVMGLFAENALKASSRGQEVTLRLDDNCGRIRFSVRDNGMPVPESLRKLLFSDPPLENERPPNGEQRMLFEFSLAGKLIDAHGGSKGAAFPAGGGTEFWFELPRA